eukprot:3799383-Heterocapsa_arctica.AAC.1
MGIDTNKFGTCFRSSKLFSSSDSVQNDRRSARNLMVIARMPRRPLKTVKNLQTPSKPYKP